MLRGCGVCQTVSNTEISLLYYRQRVSTTPSPNHLYAPVRKERGTSREKLTVSNEGSKLLIMAVDIDGETGTSSNPISEITDV